MRQRADVRCAVGFTVSGCCVSGAVGSRCLRPKKVIAVLNSGVEVREYE